MLSVSSTKISIFTLGDCIVSDADGGIGPPANFLRIAVYLLLEGRGRPVLRSRVRDLIWSEHVSERANADIRQSIVRIRRFQEEHGFELLSTDAQLTWLNSDHGTYFDLAEFLSLTSNPGPHSWLRMCEVYKGDLLGSIGTAGEGYEEWLSYQRDALRSRHITNISLSVRQDSPLSAPDRHYCASHLLLIDPYHEGAYRALMSDAAAHGQYSIVRELFTRCVRTLKTDLNVDPEVETIQLYQKHIGKAPDTRTQ